MRTLRTASWSKSQTIPLFHTHQHCLGLGDRITKSNGNIRSFIIAMIATIASSSPVGSEIFALSSLLVISLVVLLILRHYLPLRTTPAYLLVPIFFALVLPASIILLVPIDLSSSTRDQDVGSRGIVLPGNVLLVAWRITYWLTFALTWYVWRPHSFSRWL
jgi:hypothetical protein